MRALEDWVDGAGAERGVFLDGSPSTVRGRSAGHETLPRWFETVNETAAAPSGSSLLFPISAAYSSSRWDVIPGGVDEFRMGPSASGDFNPRDAKHRRADLLGRATGCTYIREVQVSLRGRRNPRMSIPYAIDTESAPCGVQCVGTERRHGGEDPHTARPPNSQCTYGGGDVGVLFG